MFNKFVNNYLTNLIKKIIDEQKLKQTDAVCEKFLLPEPDRAELLAHSIQRTPKDFVTAFTPPKTAMDSADAVMDSAVNQNCAKFQDKFAISGTVSDIIYTHFATQGFIGFQACAILSQNWLINKACSLPPKEAIATEYNLSYELNNEDEEMDDNSNDEEEMVEDDDQEFNDDPIISLSSSLHQDSDEVSKPSTSSSFPDTAAEDTITSDDSDVS